MMIEQDQFRDAIRSAGLEPPAEIQPGKLIRFSTNGKPADTAGWCKLFEDGRGGVFGDHRLRINETWQARRTTPFTKAEQEVFRRQCEQVRNEREQEQARQHESAAKLAATILQAANSDPSTHRYHLEKIVPLGLGVKRGAWPQRGWTDALLVPIYGPDRKLWSIEAINADGDKDFLKHGKKRGGFYPIGALRGAQTILIGEGVATVAAAAQATGLPAVAALDCGNLEAAAHSIKQIEPRAELIFLADNDVKADGSNPGLKAATEAARANRARMAVPELEGRKCDFWDLYRDRGAEAVAVAITGARNVEREAVAWPEPQPLTIEMAPVPYPIDALPQRLQAAVVEVQAFTQAPMALVSQSALAAVSLATQPLVDVQRASQLTGPVSLYLLTIADSGERKSTCDGYFTKAIDDFQAQRAEAAKPVLADYRAEKSAWEAKREGLRDKIRHEAKIGKSIDDWQEKLREHEFTMPQAPRVTRLLRGDETPENLAWALAHEYPSGGVISAEAGLILGAHGMGKESVLRNLGLLNTLWDGKPHSIGRRTSESFTVKGARLTVGLQVQQAAIESFFERAEGLARGTGFLARFLIACPESTQGNRRYVEPPANWPALGAFNYRLGELMAATLPINDGGGLTPKLLSFSAEAKAAWIRFHDTIEAELRIGGELFDCKDFASKAADNAARLAALFHVFEHAPDGAIHVDPFESASRVVAWHLMEARRFFAQIAHTPTLWNAARLDGFLIQYACQHKTGSVPTRTIQQYGPNSLRSREDIEATVAELAALGRAKMSVEGRKQWVEINPALLVEGNR